jgi:hypothetical protein
MKKNIYIATILGLTMVIQGLAQSPAKPERQKSSPARASTPAKNPVSQLVAALDKDKNGKLSLKEVEVISDVFKLLDKDKSGELTATEFGLPSKPRSIAAEPKASRAGGLDAALKSATPNQVRKRPGKPGVKKPVSTAAKPRRSGGRSGVRQSGTARSVKKTGTSSNAPAKPKRVARSASRSKTKTPGTARRKPVTSGKKRNVVTKKAASGKPVAAAVAAKPAGSGDKELREVIEEVNSLSKEVNQAKGKIRNPNNRRIATNWLNQKYKPFVDSLTGELGSSNAEKQKAITKAKKEIENIRKLLN